MKRVGDAFARGDSLAYNVEYSPEAEDHLRHLTARQPRIVLDTATAPLSEYAEKARKDPVIVVRKGKPFAAVDEETLALGTNRKFLK